MAGKRERGVLRARAVDAKRRLASGFWMTESKSDNNISDRGENVAVRRNVRVLRQVDSCSLDEDGLYDRVCQLLGSGETNPLRVILDHAYIEGLTDAERERHVLTLSRRVRECIQRFRVEEAVG